MTLPTSDPVMETVVYILQQVFPSELREESSNVLSFLWKKVVLSRGAQSRMVKALCLLKLNPTQKECSMLESCNDLIHLRNISAPLKLAT